MLRQTNNFNLLRLVFAVFVVVTHSYPLSGTSPSDGLSSLTQGQFDFSFLGLSGFFIISGYLVYQSLERSKNLIDYFRNRVLRIFPGLLVVLLVTVALGIFVYEHDFESYIHNRSVWTYVPSNLFLITPQWAIDGIFSANPYSPTINGSLWSLLYEVSFYVLLGFLFFFKAKMKMILLLTLLFFLFLGKFFWFEGLSKINSILAGKLVLEFAPFFFFGSFLSAIKVEKIKNRLLLTLLLFLMLVAATVFRQFDSLKFFLLPPIVIFIGLSSWPKIDLAIERFGDTSYGIYIYSFPIQQTLMHFWNFTSLKLMTLSLALSVFLGYCSWHLIEKKALLFKQGRTGSIQSKGS